MAISLSRLQDLLDSNGRILMRMVLVFHPSFSMPYIVRVMLLISSITEKVNHQMTVVMWQSTIRPLLVPIAEKMSNAWEDLMVYLLSTARAVQDPIAVKMKNLSEALETFLDNDAAKGQWKVKLIGKHALFYATIVFQHKCDKTGVIMLCFIFICLHLLTFSDYWSKKLEILCRRWGCMANLISNFTCFILGIFSQNFYNNSLGNLSILLWMTVFTLSLLVVLRPRTDFGFFGFILGIVGCITYNSFGLKYPSWIIACICFGMFGFKSWLDEHWLAWFSRDSCFSNQQRRATDTNTNTIMIVSLPYLFRFFEKSSIFASAGVASGLISAAAASLFAMNPTYYWLKGDFHFNTTLFLLLFVFFFLLNPMC